jgi:hypothetical protein|tara:strand:+ start:1410 stop:1550 length:141 start_codon:yes stop_codon:yes gene_type:complete
MSEFIQWTIAILAAVGYALLIFGAWLTVEDKENAHRERFDKRKKDE